MAVRRYRKNILKVLSEMKKNNSSGVTLVELLVVIILLMVAVTMWTMNRKSQVKMAYIQEARVLINDIVAKENLAYDQTSSYIGISSKTAFTDFGVDARRNMYFREFEVETTSKTLVQTGTSGTTSTNNSPAIVVKAYGATGSDAEGMTVFGTYVYGNDDFTFTYTGL